MGVKRRKQPKLLARKLRAIRKELDVGQVRMAELVGESDPGLISRYEHGKREPSLLVLLEYAKLAKVSTDVLIDDSAGFPPARRLKR